MEPVCLPLLHWSHWLLGAWRWEEWREIMGWWSSVEERTWLLILGQGGDAGDDIAGDVCVILQANFVACTFLSWWIYIRHKKHPSRGKLTYSWLSYGLFTPFMPHRCFPSFYLYLKGAVSIFLIVKGVRNTYTCACTIFFKIVSYQRYCFALYGQINVVSDKAQWTFMLTLMLPNWKMRPPTPWPDITFGYIA